MLSFLVKLKKFNSTNHKLFFNLNYVFPISIIFVIVIYTKHIHTHTIFILLSINN